MVTFPLLLPVPNCCFQLLPLLPIFQDHSSFSPLCKSRTKHFLHVLAVGCKLLLMVQVVVHFLSLRHLRRIPHWPWSHIESLLSYPAVILPMPLSSLLEHSCLLTSCRIHRPYSFTGSNLAFLVSLLLALGGRWGVGSNSESKYLPRQTLLNHKSHPMGWIMTLFWKAKV